MHIKLQEIRNTWILFTRLLGELSRVEFLSFLLCLILTSWTILVDTKLTNTQNVNLTAFMDLYFVFRDSKKIR